jgi:hypothetical protein
MNLTILMQNLFTNNKCTWVNELDTTSEEIQPFLIQRCLAMNDTIRIQARWLDKYTFVLPPKMYLSLAWSVLPKTSRVPFSNYIKQQDEEEEFAFILDKIRKQFKLADNDYNALKSRLIVAIKKDMVNWFSYYGIPKRYWKRYNINFNLIKDFNNKRVNGQKGLNSWGL